MWYGEAADCQTCTGSQARRGDLLTLPIKLAKCDWELRNN